MVATLVKSVLTDSELVIGSEPNTAQASGENESILIEQVLNRANLLKAKPNKREFTQAEHWIERSGDLALKTLISLNEGMICALVLRYQPEKQGSADADLKQEAIAAFVDAIYRFDPARGAKLSSFAYFRIWARLKTVCDRHYRNTKAKKKAKVILSGIVEAPEMVDSYEYEDLNAALLNLPDREQQIVLLVHQDTSYSVIAELFSLSVKTVQNLYYKAMGLLRSFLGNTVSLVQPAPIEATESEVVFVETEVGELASVTTSTPAQTSVPAKDSESFENCRAVFEQQPITNAEPRKPSSCGSKLVIGSWREALRNRLSLKAISSELRARVFPQAKAFLHHDPNPKGQIRMQSTKSVRNMNVMNDRLNLLPATTAPRPAAEKLAKTTAPFALRWSSLSVAAALAFVTQSPLAMVSVSAGMVINLMAFSGPLNSLKKRLQGLAFVAAAIFLSYAMPSFAATSNSTSCPGGILSQVVGLLIGIASAAGVTSASNDLCLINQIATVVAALMFIGSLFYGILRASKDNDLTHAFTPFGFTMLGLVGSGVISKIFFGAFV